MHVCGFCCSLSLLHWIVLAQPGSAISGCLPSTCIASPSHLAVSLGAPGRLRPETWHRSLGKSGVQWCQVCRGADPQPQTVAQHQLNWGYPLAGVATSHPAELRAEQQSIASSSPLAIKCLEFPSGGPWPSVNGNRWHFQAGFCWKLPLADPWGHPRYTKVQSLLGLNPIWPKSEWAVAREAQTQGPCKQDKDEEDAKGLVVLVEVLLTAGNGTCRLDTMPCGLWLLSCLLHAMSWSHRQGYGALRSQRAGPGVCRRSAAAGTHSAAAEVILPLSQLMWWWSGAGGFKGWQMGLCAGADCSFVACFLIVFWLFFCAFLLTLIFSEMKYPVSNCSQIVIIVCRQMAHSLWSSNHMRETAALSCVYKYWCWSVAVSWGPVWAALPPAVMLWVPGCVPCARGPHEVPGYL